MTGTEEETSDRASVNSRNAIDNETYVNATQDKTDADNLKVDHKKTAGVDDTNCVGVEDTNCVDVEDNRDKMKKNITVTRGIALVIGGIIGTGIFITPNSISR